MLAALNGWLGGLFHPDNVDQTVSALLASQPDGSPSADIEGARERLRDAERRLRRFQEAIAAGVAPAAIVDGINQAQAEHAAAKAQVESAPARSVLDRAEVYAMVDSLGDVGATLGGAKPEKLAKLHATLDVSIRYEPEERAAHVTTRPRVDSAGVRGGT
jgi:hypothetical protein